MGAGLLCLAATSAHALTLNQESQTYVSLSGTSVTMTGHSELHLTGAADPIPGTTINLTSEDSWVFFHHTSVPPSYVNSTLLSRFQVNGVAAALNTNVRIVAYGEGAVVIPQSASYKPLTVYTGRNFTGNSWQPNQYTRYNSPGQMGVHYDGIRSFTLKRGYMATFAANTNGTGPSKCYVAQDSDLEVAVMPGDLDKSVSFVRVFPWRWTKKKGIGGNIGQQLDNGWWYDWNLDQVSNLDKEYVAIRQSRWWPGLDRDWNYHQINHLLGYNEPNNSVEANLTVGDAIWSWPDCLWDGLRVGSPAPTDGGRPWLYDFMNQAATGDLRVDFVAIHYYWSFSNPNDPAGAAAQMYGFLEEIHNTTGKPIWITEWNNGANWTTNNPWPAPTYAQQAAAIQAMTQMLEDTPWVERYAAYNWVEDTRRLQWDDGPGTLTAAGVAYRDIPSNIGHVQEVPDSGASPVAKYFYDGDFRDDSGNGNNPLVYGTPKVVTGTPFGGALSLDGTDDYLMLPPKVANASDFTFAAWVKWDGGGNWQRIFDCGTGTNNYMFLSPNNGSNLRFAIQNNGGGEQGLSTGPLTPGVWTHVAVTLSGNTGTMYVNGNQVNTGSITINPNQLGATKCYLGDSQFANDPLFAGSLDNVYFLNYALGSSDVALLASTTDTTPPAAPANLVSNAGNGVVYLDWNDSPEADLQFYSVYRSGTMGSGYSLVASGVTASEFADATVTNGQTYYYVVRAVDTRSNESANSNEEVANPRGELLIAHYKFEGNYQDSSGFGNHGTAAGYPSFVSGPVNLGLNFDAVNDAVTLPQGIANGSDITIATWVYWRGGGEWQRIFDFGTDANHNLFLTPRSGGDNTLRFAITETGNPGEKRLEAPQLAINQWVHVAVVLNGDIGTLYVNGEVADTATITVNPGDFNPVVNYLGDSQYPSDPLLNGALDDFRVYSYALSPNDIEDLVDHTEPVLPDNREPLAYFRFQEGAAGAEVTPQVDNIIDSEGGNDTFRTYANYTAPNYIAAVPSATVPQTHAANTLSTEFDGGDDFYQNVVGPLRSNAIGDFTAEAYVYFTDLTGIQTFIGRDDNAAGSPGAESLFYLTKWNGDNHFRVRLYTAGGNYITVESPYTAAANTWYHVAAVGDTTKGTFTLYVNGAPAGSTTGFDGLFDPAANDSWTIGRGQYGGAGVDFMKGYIDEVRFSGSALRPDQFLNFNPDTDNDNLHDTWELANFRNLSQSGFGDPDGDGFNNIAEEANGTVPTISDLIPQLGMTVSGDLMTISWPTNHIGWRLEYSENLEPGSWVTLPGSDETNSYEAQMFQGGVQHGFFRLAYP